MIQSRVFVKITATVCLFLVCMMGLVPAAHAGSPQPFSGDEVTALAQQQSQSMALTAVTCGMSDGAKKGMGGVAIGLAVVALVLAVGMLASTAGS